MNPTSHFSQLSDCQLHYLEWAGNDPPVLFIPGFIANAYGALCLAQAIHPLRRVLALDLRGRGKSDKPHSSYGIPAHVEDIHLFLQTLNLPRVILAGHSFGAATSLFFAAKYPEMVEKIILLDGGTPPSPLAIELFMAYHQNLSYDYPSVESYLAPYRQMVTMQPWTEEAEQLIRANIIEQTDGTAQRAVPRHVVEAELAQISSTFDEKLRAIYPQIHVPVLLIRAGMGSFGQQDQHITPEILATLQANLPQLHVYEMPTAGHTSILTIPAPQRDQLLQNFAAKP